jgi:hypothetical protein
VAESFGVIPAELRATSRRLNEVGSRIKDVRARLQEKLSAEGAVWGDDGLGSGYADGDEGFLAQLHWVGGSVDAKTDLLDLYSRGLKGAADSSERSDGSWPRSSSWWCAGGPAVGGVGAGFVGGVDLVVGRRRRASRWTHRGAGQ